MMSKLSRFTLVSLFALAFASYGVAYAQEEGGEEGGEGGGEEGGGEAGGGEAGGGEGGGGEAGGGGGPRPPPGRRWASPCPRTRGPSRSRSRRPSGTACPTS